MFLGQGFQHFFVALSTADLLSATTIKSGFVSIDSRHSDSPACKRFTTNRPTAEKAPWLVGAGQKKLTPGNFQVQHGARLSQEFLNREGATCCSGCLRGQDLKYTLH